MTDADIEDITFSKSDIDFIRPELLSWYRANRRKFPWRGDETILETTKETYEACACNAYGTWVSEVMLQQTRTETVHK